MSALEPGTRVQLRYVDGDWDSYCNALEVFVLVRGQFGVAVDRFPESQ